MDGSGRVARYDGSLCVRKGEGCSFVACLVQKLLLYTQRSVYGALLVLQTA